MIKRFNDYIIERLGVSSPTYLYIDFLANYLFDEFLDNYKTKSKHYKKNINIPYILIKNNISSKDKDLFKSFPIKEFNIKLKIEKMEFDDVNKTFSIGGAAWPLSFREGSKKLSSIISPSGFDKTSSLSIRMEFYFNIHSLLELTESDLSRMKTDLKATISHELNHIYEGYKRQLDNGEIKINFDRAIDTSIGTVNFKNPNEELISEDLYNKWLDLCDLLYKSEPQEINAMSQETLVYIMDNNFTQNDLNKIYTWEEAKKMIEFDSDKFYNELLLLADGKKETLDYLKYMFLDKMKRELKNWKLITKEGKFRTKHDIDRLDRIDCYMFIKDYGRIINKSGERLKKNIIRLFSYENDK